MRKLYWSLKLGYLCSLLIIVTIVFAQPGSAATISGHVTDTTGHALPNIPVYYKSGIIGCGDHYNDFVLTNNNGEYSFTSTVANTYYVKTGGGETDFAQIFWAEGGTTPDCSKMTGIPITSTEQQENNKNFKLEIGSVIEGDVIAADTNQGIPDVIVHLIPLGFMQCHFQGSLSGTTNSSGHFTISGLALGDYIVGTSYDEDNYVDEWWASGTSALHCPYAETISITSPGQSIQHVDFQLDPSASISGTIIDENSNPLEGISVASEFKMLSHPNYISNASDPNGSYSLKKLKAGTYKIETRTQTAYLKKYWTSSGGSYYQGDAESITISAGQSVTDKDFHLSQGIPVSGIITDSANDPVTGAYVYGEDVTGLLPVSNVTTNTQGNFTLYVVPNNKYTFKASTQQHNYIPEYWSSTTGTAYLKSQAEEISITTESIDINFTFETGAIITGEILSESGDPLSNILVNALGTSSGCTFSSPYASDFMVNTNNAGFYSISGLPEGNYHVFASETVTNGTYVTAWHTANGNSNNCSSSEPITVTTGSTVEDINFVLSHGEFFSGVIYESNGSHPVRDKDYSVYIFDSDPCATPPPHIVGGGYYSPYRGLQYRSSALAPGQYYLGILDATRALELNLSNIESFWSFPHSVVECSQARPLTIRPGKSRSGTDFNRTLPPGDMDGDGRIDLNDVILGLQIISGGNPSFIELEMGDTNQNNTLDLMDILWIINVISQ